MYHIIIAGGVGSRFWPLSREEKPKQFLKLIDNVSLIKSTYNRLLKISKDDKIFILAPEKYKKNIIEEFPKINPNNIIIEPSPMNTAPAIYLASRYIQNLDKKALIGIYPSDHYIKNDKEFIEKIKNIRDFLAIEKEGIVTIGINPTYPSSSYGYINLNKNKKSDNEIYKIKKFIEKPDTTYAKKLIKNENNLWNSGMFFFNARFMINEIELYLPKVKNLFSQIDSINQINEIWDKMPKESIDYAVMEKTNLAYCINSALEWSDLGTWMSLYQLLDKDKNNNASKGKVLCYNSFGNLIISKNRITAAVGLNNVAIINLEDATLVIDLFNSEEVRHIIDQLKSKEK